MTVQYRMYDTTMVETGKKRTILTDVQKGHQMFEVMYDVCTQ